MITYRIEVETHHAKWFLRKEYLSYPQALKALKMMHPYIPKKYGDCVIRIYQFEDERCIKLMS
jgi:hypothetical protein